MPRKKKIKAFDFSAEINKLMEQYGDAVNVVVEDSLKAVAEKAERELQAVNKFSPRGNPSGEYSKDWTYRITPEKRFSYRATVYNEEHYRLTHLLENGHALRRGGREIGRVQPYPHIAPVNEMAQREIVSEITRRIEREG